MSSLRRQRQRLGRLSFWLSFRLSRASSTRGWCSCFIFSGDSYQYLEYMYRIPKQTLSYVIPETCKAIYTALKDKYLKVSSTKWRAETNKLTKKILCFNFYLIISNDSVNTGHIELTWNSSSELMEIHYQREHFWSVVTRSLNMQDIEIAPKKISELWISLVTSIRTSPDGVAFMIISPLGPLVMRGAVVPEHQMLLLDMMFLLFQENISV